MRDEKGRFVKGHKEGYKKGHPQYNTGRTHFKKGEHISPKNEIRDDDQPENLQVFVNNAEHRKAHSTNKSRQTL